MEIEYTTHYCADTDMTFITKDEYNAQGDPLTTSVIGFYFGEPDGEKTTKVMCESVNDPSSALTASYIG